MSKVAVMLADGFEEIEGLTVVDVLRRGGIDTVMVSIMGRPEVVSSHNIEIKTDMLMEQVDFDAVDMIVLPGGLKGKENLENCAPLMAELDAFFAAGKYIAAICAAPTILGHRGMLKGRKACCYGGMEEELTGAEVSYDKVSVAGHIITSRGMGTSVAFALHLLAVLKDERAAEEMAAKIMYTEEWK